MSIAVQYTETVPSAIVKFMRDWTEIVLFGPKPEYCPNYIENRMRHIVRNLDALRSVNRGRYVLTHKGKSRRRGYVRKTHHTPPAEMREFVVDACQWLNDVHGRLKRQETELDRRLYAVVQDLFDGTRSPFGPPHNRYADYLAYHIQMAKEVKQQPVPPVRAITSE